MPLCREGRWEGVVRWVVKHSNRGRGRREGPGLGKSNSWIPEKDQEPRSYARREGDSRQDPEPVIR